MNELRVSAPLIIHCRMCGQTITVPCRSDSQRMDDGTFRLTVHLNHQALQEHFDTHDAEER
jgi:hypothetical protein